MLTDDYRRVVKTSEYNAEPNCQAAPNSRVHALWIGREPREGLEWRTDVTMCGQVESLDVINVGKSRVVTCGDCLKALKRERQSRSAAGLVRAQERRNEKYVEADRHAANPDADLIERMQARATSLRAEGYEGIATDLEIVAGRLADHATVPHDSSVLQARTSVLMYDGPERRCRPRHITGTTEDEL
jgi:hypothetical protein